MDILSHCSDATIPGGLRRVRRAARRAGFDGTLQLTCYGHDDMTQEEFKTGVEFVTRGTFLPGLIHLYLTRTKHSRSEPIPARAEFSYFLHELGHHKRHTEGRHDNFWTPDMASDHSKYLRSASERYANKYAKDELNILWPS